MVCIITTSRYPTRRIRSFTKDLNKAIPFSVRVSRGKKGIKDLTELSYKYGLSRVMVISKYKGNPGKINFLKLCNGELSYLPFTILVKGVQLYREIPVSRRIQIDKEEIESFLLFSFKKQGLFEELNLISTAFNIPYKVIESLTELKNLDFRTSCLLVKKDAEVRISFHDSETLKEIGPRIKIKGILQWKKKK